MAVTSTPIFPQAIKNTAITILNSDAQTYKTAFTGGTNGSRIEGWFVSSTDTSNRDITINFTISATNYQISQISIPLSAGTVNSVPAVNILQSAQIPNIQKDSSGNPYLYVASGTTVTINAPVTVTSAKTITSVIQAADY
jgi:hypothetical protein